MTQSKPGRLVDAVREGDLEQVKAVLDRGAEINTRYKTDRTALHLALSQGHQEVALLLLDRGAQPAAADRLGRTPLHLAARQGMVNVVSRLLELGASPVVSDRDGDTPLHEAARFNHVEPAAVLLQGTPDIDATNDQEQTPLVVAVTAGANGVVQLLLEHGADRDVRDREGTPLLDLVFRTRDLRAVELLAGTEARRRLEAGLADATEHHIPEQQCEDLMLRLEALKSAVASLELRPSFDVNRFLEVFDHVRPRSGYVLDYYHPFIDDPSAGDGSGGHHYGDAAPLVFTRPEEQPHEDAIARFRDQPWRLRHQMDHLEFERSAEGYLQWAVFSVAVHQFHLCWHANYNDLRYLLSRASLERLLENLRAPEEDSPGDSPDPYSISMADRKKLRNLDLTPWVKVAGDLGEVRALTFTDWGGFAFHHLHLRWPHHVDRVIQEVVVPYDCGILF